jgi:hypothetical protein
MHCCRCGAKLADDAKSCAGCHAPVASEESSRAGPPNAVDQEAIISEILAQDSHSGSCHKCGSNLPLHTWRFGLGKIVSSRRDWGETAVSAAVSAVTLPLLGAGALRFPGKKTSFHMLQLRLRLCDSCARSKDTAYSMHPGWRNATSLGYTEFFDATELRKLQISS